MPLTHIADADRETLHNTIDVNLTGLIKLTHAVIPTMLEQESGHVVNLSSVVGRFLMENRSHYNAAKAGVKMFGDSLRLDVAAEGIRVAIIELGSVATELLEGTPTKKSKRRSRNTARRCAHSSQTILPGRSRSS